MGDFEIDVEDVFADDTIDRLTKYIAGDTMNYAPQQARAEKQRTPRKRATYELGTFRVVKCNNGFVVRVGTSETMTEDTYVCEDASEIGALITAHIIANALED